MPIQKTAKRAQATPKESKPIVKILQRLFILLLVLASGWLYGTNLSLSQENRALGSQNVRLKMKVAELSKPRKKNSKLSRIKTADPSDVYVLTPLESARLHLERAQDALQRKDYAAAVREWELADSDADKALGQVSRASDEARKSIEDRLKDLQKRLPGV